MKKLLRAVICNFFVLIFGMDSRQLNILISGENGKWLRTIFFREVDNLDNGNVTPYVSKIYEEIF